MMRTTLVAAVLAIGALLSLATHVGAQQSSPTIFWIDGTAIKSANLDGTGEQTLTTESSTPGGIAVYASQVYWTAGSSIKSMNWDGSGTETVLTDGSAALRGLAVDGAKVYWASSDSIKSANLDGTGEQTLATAAVATAVAVSSEKVYFSFRWNSSGFYRLSSMDKSGSNTSVIYSAPTASNSSRAIYGIAVNEPSGKVYAVQTTSSGYNSGGQFIWNTGSISLLSWDLDGSNYSSLKTLSGTRGSVLSNAGYVAYSQDPSRIVVAYAGSRVRSYDTSGGDEQTPSISVTALKGLAFQALDLPIVTVSTSESTAALEWNAIDGATDYQYRYKQKTELSWSTPATTGETTALVTGLIAGTDYDFQVRSRLNGIAEEWSGTAYARTSPRTLMITRWPARVGGVVIQDQGMGSAQMQWQHQVNALDYEIGLWDAGQLHDLAVQGASATVTIPDVWEQVNASLGVLSGDIYPEFDPANPYVGPYEDDPAKVILQRNRRYSGNILYYWHTGMGIWRVLRCESPTDGGCDYGSPSSAEVRTVVTVRSSIFNWFNLDAGPPEWGGVYTDEDEALEAASVAGVTVIFLDPLGYARYRRLNSTSPSATVTGLADGRQYLAVRGVTSDGRYGAWSYLGTMGTELAPAPSVPDSLGATTDLFYTDKLIVSQNYQYDEETLIIQWPSLLGARHYDIRLHGTNVQRIPAAGGQGRRSGSTWTAPLTPVSSTRYEGSSWPAH